LVLVVVVFHRESFSSGRRKRDAFSYQLIADRADRPEVAKLARNNVLEVLNVKVDDLQQPAAHLRENASHVF
jgi:hypothetical protein